MNWLELYWTDVYKVGHKFMLPPNSLLMYSNLTPRSGKLANIEDSEGVLSMGAQLTARKMKKDWDMNFFSHPVEEIHQFGRDMTEMLMLDTPFDVSHFIELHELGYLPIRFKAIPEGTFIPYKVPMTTIVNTKKLSSHASDFLVNYLETIMSAEGWQAPTSATTALHLKTLGKMWIDVTDPESAWFLDYQFHDFSMRGMGGKSAIVNSGLGFASCFRGSDTLPVIPAARMYYDEVKACINSVIATEHAIMCTLTGFFLVKNDGTWEEIGKLELETFRELLKRFPNGILSIVSDTWDLWRVILDYMVQLKDEILARKGKVVIRPDSGDPVDIITGTAITVRDINKLPTQPSIYTYYVLEDDSYYDIVSTENGTVRMKVEPTPEHKGVISLLWDIFGGTMTSTGYKKLDEHVGAIYGDSITYKRASNIFDRLAVKRFASTNIVLGIGSYSLQYVTRDTHGFAQKATYVEIEENGQPIGIEIFKDPITDKGGVKKSARGLLCVIKDENGKYVLLDQVTKEMEEGGELQVIFEDGELYNPITLTEIRERVNNIINENSKSLAESIML